MGAMENGYHRDTRGNHPWSERNPVTGNRRTKQRNCQAARWNEREAPETKYLYCHGTRNGTQCTNKRRFTINDRNILNTWLCSKCKKKGTRRRMCDSPVMLRL